MGLTRIGQNFKKCWPIREGDIVLVSELDRLGRNDQDLTKIMNTIQNKGATLDVLNLRQLMTNLIIELYKYQAESERKRIIERQQQGIALAKRQGKYHGRKPQYTQDRSPPATCF